MNNGQISSASLQTAVPFITQDQTAPTAVIDGEQKQTGNFAGVLGDTQLLVAAKVSAVAGHAEPLQESSGMVQMTVDAGVEQRLADLLALLQMSPKDVPASHPAISDDTENADHPEKAELQSNEPSHAESLMALAAYVQSGRTPEVTVPPILPADQQQERVTSAEHPVAALGIAPHQEIHAESKVPMAQESQSSVAFTAVKPETAHGLPEVNKLTQPSVGVSPKMAVVNGAPAVINHAEHVVAELAPPSAVPTLEAVTVRVEPPVAEQKQHGQPEQTRSVVFDRQSLAPDAAVIVEKMVPMDALNKTPDVSKLTQHPADAHLNRVTTTDQSIIPTAPVVAGKPEQSVMELIQPEVALSKPVTSQTEQLVVEVITQNQQPLTETTVPTGAQVKAASVVQKKAEPNAPEGHQGVTRIIDISQSVAIVAEKPAVTALTVEHVHPEMVASATVVQVEKSPSIRDVSKSAQLSAVRVQEPEVPAEKLSVQLSAAAEPVTPPESELDIQLSQPRPITARGASTNVSAAHRSAGLVVPQSGAALLVETGRAGTEAGTSKETSSSLLRVAPVGEVAIDAGTSSGFGGTQTESDTTSDNQLSAGQMRGPLNSDLHKASATPGRLAQPEAVRLDVPEQVLQQVKERLVQHDVKAGSQQITLTLSPDALGELKVNLNLQGQKLSVEIVTENRAVRDAIAQHTDALKESLARQNITMESFDVTTGGKGSGQGQNQNAWRELAKQHQQQVWASPRSYQSAQADLPSPSATYQKQNGQSMLDIHY